MIAKRIYLDHAATSWPKSDEVLQAVEHYLVQCGATSGRGAYSSAREADRLVADARRHLSHLLGTNDPDSIAFCSSGTHALNACLFGLLKPGFRVITTQIEHNSVLRPLEHMRQSHSLDYIVAPCNANGLVDVEQARTLARNRWGDEKFHAIVLNHASNVTGALQPLEPWRKLADVAEALLIVDASQTLGHAPIQFDYHRIDALAFAGHKGLGGIAGSGGLALHSRLRSKLVPILYGGTGTSSEKIDPIPPWPQSVEVGNHNLPSIAAMGAAAKILSQHPNSVPTNHPTLAQLLTGIQPLISAGKLRLHGHSDPGIEWLPIVSLTSSEWDIHELAAVLDASFGVEVRAGFHCAALIHQAIGSAEAGGTLRISLGRKTSASDIEATVEALQSAFS